MKNFIREDLKFSLCGLNCALCVMKLDGFCPGCGGGEGNQSCAIARCGMEKGRIAYCYECGEYPCGRYRDIELFDSFITHRCQLRDMDRVRTHGASSYHAALEEKTALLRHLLANYNDGRHKTFFCLAVNLLELSDVKAVVDKIEREVLPEATVKEKARTAATCFENMAKQRDIILKLNKTAKRK